MKLVFKYENETKEMEISTPNLIFDLGLEGEQNGEIRNGHILENGLVLKLLLPEKDKITDLKSIEIYEQGTMIETLKEITRVTYRLNSGKIVSGDAFRIGLIERLQFNFKM